MTRILVLAACLLALASPSFAQTSAIQNVCPGIINPITPLGYTQQTVTSLVASTLTIPSGSQMAVVEVETAAIRYRDDGTAPTTAVGTPVASAGSVVICGLGIMTNWKAIASAANAKLNTSFYGRP